VRSFSPDDHVLFDSNASNIASFDANGSFDVFLYDTLSSSVVGRPTASQIASASAASCSLRLM
jgi:hypothetical protein